MSIKKLKPQSFIFIGRSGSGKGTQAELLIENLKKSDAEHEVFYIQVGKEFREFIKGPSLTQRLAKKIIDAGGLQPEFVAVYQWVHALVERYEGDQHLIFDGSPRRLPEAHIIDSIFSFYGLDMPHVIYLDVHHEESTARLLKRGREDDTHEAIANRMAWYEADVAPIVEFYKKNPKYKFLDINGVQPIEKVHADIVKALGLK